MTPPSTVNGSVAQHPTVPPALPLALPPRVSLPVSPWPRQEAVAAVRQEARQEEVSAPRQEPRHPKVRHWPLIVIASPAAVAIWSGWVALGALCGFGLVDPFPGIVSWHLDTAITLPVGVEAYGAYALGAWLSPGTPGRARAWARVSAIGSLALGAAGQVIYHLLAAAHATRAPAVVVVVVSCIPVVTLGCAAALTHLLRAGDDDSAPDRTGDGSDASGGDDDRNTDGTAPDVSHDPPPPASPSPPDRQPRRDKVGDTIRRHPDWDDGKIAAQCGVSKRTVQRRREAARKAVPAG